MGIGKNVFKRFLTFFLNVFKRLKTFLNVFQEGAFGIISVSNHLIFYENIFELAASGKKKLSLAA